VFIAIERSARRQAYLWVVLLAILIGVLSTSALYDPYSPPAYRLPITVMVLGTGLLVSGFNLGLFCTRRVILLILWTGYATVSLASAILNGTDLLPELWQLVGIPLFIISLVPNATKEQGIYVVVLSIILGFSPYIIVSLLAYPLSYPYQGVFVNPNSMGMISATLFGAVLTVLRGSMQSIKRSGRNRLKTGFHIFVLLALAVIVAASNSATSFGTIFISSLIFFGLLLREPNKYRFWIGSYLMMVSTLVCLIFFTTSNESLFGSLAGKFMAKAEGADILSGRDIAWREILENIETFGIGARMDLFNTIPHNTYLWVLGTKGPIALLFYCAVQLQVVFLAWRLAVRRIHANGYAIGPLLIVMNYVVMGMSENVISILGDGIQMTYILMLGILTQKEIGELGLVSENGDE